MNSGLSRVTRWKRFRYSDATPCPYLRGNEATHGPDRSPMSSQMDRRTLLLGSAQMSGLLAAGPLLAACGSDSKKTTAAASGGAKSFGTLDLRLAWIKNVEFAGEYLADAHGYYKAEGF